MSDTSMAQAKIETSPTDATANPKRTPTAADILLRMPQLDAGQWSTIGAALRWLIMARAAVLPMTASAAVIAVLLALASGPIEVLPALLLFVGLVAAHATKRS
ncbi:MAG: hypothetical protein U5O39_11305 [Gammaproteobacteria bacterium]|nr:hypothetical protein [Gammaproteobacteria bacterium]